MAGQSDETLPQLVTRVEDLGDYCSPEGWLIADLIDMLEAWRAKYPLARIKFDSGSECDGELLIRWDEPETPEEVAERLEADARWKQIHTRKRAALESLTPEQREALGLESWQWFVL